MADFSGLSDAELSAQLAKAHARLGDLLWLLEGAIGSGEYGKLVSAAKDVHADLVAGMIESEKRRLAPGFDPFEGAGGTFVWDPPDPPEAA